MAHPTDAFERPKRFYKAVAVAPAEGGFAVTLDGRIPRTPHRRPLVAPTEALAQHIAAEWAAQGEYITLTDMPATRLANTALDGAPGARADLAAEVARFAGSDLLCYFAEAPRSLVEREETRWIPLIAWAEQALGVRFVRASGIGHRPQPAETLTIIEALAAAQDDFNLTGLAFGAALFGSAILALALQRGRLDGVEALGLSRLDELFQEETWGQDAEAAGKAGRMAGEAAMLERWFRALG